MLFACYILINNILKKLLIYPKAFNQLVLFAIAA
jgi:hypothetical protein